MTQSVEDYYRSLPAPQLQKLLTALESEAAMRREQRLEDHVIESIEREKEYQNDK